MEPAVASIPLFIVYVPESDSNSIDVQLEHDDVLFDPRIIGYYKGEYSFSVKGRTLTITRTDKDEGWDGFFLRAYLPTEVIPDFTFP